MTTTIKKTGDTSDNPVSLDEENQDLRNRIKELKSKIDTLENQHDIASSANEFLAVLSHEIRSPLNVILGLADLLLHDNPREDQAQNLKSLLFSAENMMNLVNNILDFNRIKSGKMSRKEDVFNLKDTLTNLEQSFIHHADKKNNELQLKIDDEIPEIVRGDRLKLIQILSNLLSNALKFTENGLVTLEVKCVDSSFECANIYFSVRDTGPGISEKNLNLIFDRFSRTEDSITQRVGGTGLGLFMVERLLKMMGSQIEVSSTLGEGSDFNFTLSLKKPLDKAKGSSDRHKNNIQTVTKVLLAEDTDEHREVLRQYFEQQDRLEFTIVSDGDEVLQAIQEDEYDIIFLDIKMPKLNGHEVARHIRSQSSGHYQSVPVIALTADVFAIDEDHNEFTDIITKPFKFRQLIEAINHYAG